MTRCVVASLRTQRGDLVSVFGRDYNLTFSKGMSPFLLSVGKGRFKIMSLEPGPL